MNRVVWERVGLPAWMWWKVAAVADTEGVRVPDVVARAIVRELDALRVLAILAHRSGYASLPRAGAP